MQTQFKKHPFTSQGVVGGAIVLVGLLLLAYTTGVYDTTRALQFIPSLFVLVGLYALVSSRLRNLAGPVVLIVVAGAVQLVTLDIVAGSDIVSLWPLLLVVAGLSILLGQVRAATRTVSASRLDAFAILGGNTQRATSDTFGGGTLTAILGGVELDLRDTTVDDGPARIDATCLFGGIDITIPEDWDVQIDILPLLGGVEDTRPHRARPKDEHDESQEIDLDNDQEIDLVITGFVAFGGLTLK